MNIGNHPFSNQFKKNSVAKTIRYIVATLRDEKKKVVTMGKLTIQLRIHTNDRGSKQCYNFNVAVLGFSFLIFIFSVFFFASLAGSFFFFIYGWWLV